MVPEGLPWSAGALVDRAGLKGASVGGARVSPTHGNFIVNEGSATAADIRRLIDRCRAAVRERFGVELREEIVYLGDFDDSQRSLNRYESSDDRVTASSPITNYQSQCHIHVQLLLIEGGRALSAAPSQSKATRTRRCRCWRRVC